MTVEEYRQRMIEAFHNADCDNLIALVALPSEKEFEHLEWLLKNHYHNQKQEPCEDCISRQAVLDGLASIAKVKARSDAQKSLMGRVMFFVEQLPSVIPKEKTGWILVSERLPEDKTYVLTTIKVPKRIAHARSGWYDGGFFMNDNGDTWRATDKEVIAWMPLPEPFEPQESEDKE